MLTRYEFHPPTAPTLAGDATDAKRVLQYQQDSNKAIADFFRTLNAPYSLAIDQAAIRAFSGVQFPATQVLSADLNTLDDYEEATWTPTASLSTPGTSAFTPTVAVGDATKIGNRVIGGFRYTATLAIGTGSGNMQIGTLPYTPSSDANFFWDSAVTWGGITMPGGRTQLSSTIVAGSTTLLFAASGSALAAQTLAGADVTGTLVLRGAFSYRTA
jgi:hypothetical protein